MLHRYRYGLMEAANEAPAAGANAPTVVTSPTPPVAAAPAAPAPGEEYKNMTLEQFNARLSKASEGGTKALVKELGFEKIEDVKAAIAKAREEAEAKKSAEQKMQEKIAALEPAAKRTADLEMAVKKYLDAEVAAIPAEKQALLALAPTEPHARLEWIALAKTQGLFAVAAPVAPAAAPTAPLANTRAGNGNPPPPAPPAGQKHPRDMTDAEYRAYEAQWKASAPTRG